MMEQEIGKKKLISKNKKMLYYYYVSFTVLLLIDSRNGRPAKPVNSCETGRETHISDFQTYHFSFALKMFENPGKIVRPIEK
jgi:hypothetical protein